MHCFNMFCVTTNLRLALKLTSFVTTTTHNHNDTAESQEGPCALLVLRMQLFFEV